MAAYEDFIAKLDAFLGRYYANRAWKGLFALLSVSLAVFLVFCAVEYLLYLPGNLRKILFWLFVVLFWAGFGILVFYPWGQSRGWFSRMSRQEAARYLALRYPELDDRLYNVLDLKRQLQENGDLYVLLEAAIEQISRRFVAYRFEKAVNFRANRRYILAFLLVLATGTAIYFVNPGIIGSSERIVRYGRYFEREFPFSIFIRNESLHVAYEEDFTLDIDVQGDMLPAEVFVETDGRLFPCRRNSPVSFSYVFRKVRQPVEFRLVGGKYRSAPYVLEVNYKPLMSGMKVTLRYPPYMNRRPEVVDNSLNLQIPAGTKVDWNLKIDHAEKLLFGFFPLGEPLGEDVSLREAKAQPPVFSFSGQIFNSCTYRLIPKAFAEIKTDTASFAIEVFPDAYPRIEVVPSFDSNRIYRRYFHGMISDDYGFHSLLFKLSCTNAATGNEWTFYDTLPVKAYELSQEFTYYFDIDEFNPQPGDELSYGFELRDNDAFYPFKPVYSQTFFYRKMSQEEVREEVGRTSASVDEKFSLSMRSVQHFDRELQDFVQDLLSKKQLSWQDMKRVDLLLEQQENLRETYKELSEEIKEKQRLESELGEADPELQEKQRQLQDLMDKLFDDATMKKLQDLQELMRQNAPREKITDALEDVKRQKDLLSRDIERNLNLYKQLEFENKLRQAVSDAQALSEKSKEVGEKMRHVSADSALKLQEDLQKDRNRLEKDLQKVEDLNEGLEKQTSFSLPDSLLKKARQDIETTKEDLQVGKVIDGIRDKVFLVSKVLPENASVDGTIRACENSLRKLHTDRLDLYLLHWKGSRPFEDTIKAMTRLQRGGKILRWGVSNIDVPDMEKIVAMPGGAACEANQVLYNLGERGVEFDLIPWSQSYRMPVIAYSPIAEGRLLRNPVLLKIAEKHGVTPAQIALAWTIRLDGVMAIPKASSSDHVIDNFKALDIILDEDDLRALDATFPPRTKRIPLAGW